MGARPVGFPSLTPPPASGRRYAEAVRPAIDGASTVGRIRLDAIAGWLQDAAYWDLVDAGWHAPAPWIIRRLRLSVQRFPVLGEIVEVDTWCSGYGRAVAERRTTVRGSQGAHVEALALWVQIDPVAGRPLVLSDEFLAVYAEAAEGRKSRTKLHHPKPPAGLEPVRSFPFRTADIDPAGHVNNAAYWAVLEDELRTWPADAPFDAEVEHHAPADAGACPVLSDGAERRWVLDGAGTLVASFALATA